MQIPVRKTNPVALDVVGVSFSFRRHRRRRHCRRTCRISQASHGKIAVAYLTYGFSIKAASSKPAWRRLHFHCSLRTPLGRAGKSAYPIFRGGNTPREKSCNRVSHRIYVRWVSFPAKTGHDVGITHVESAKSAGYDTNVCVKVTLFLPRLFF